MGEFLLILIIIALLWPWFMKWLKRFMAHRAEDMMRKMMGQPTRRQERKQRRRAESEQRRNAGSTRSRRQSAPGNAADSDTRRETPQESPASMMSTVAEDVQFTEIREFSETDTFHDGKEEHHYHERQVEDVEYTEVRKDTRK